MLQQSFDAKHLLKVISRKDVRDWDLWSRDSEITTVTNRLAQAIKISNYSVNGLVTEVHKGNTTYRPSCAQDHIAIKLIDLHIRRIYKVVQSDRNRIIREIRALLRDGGKLSIIREDVRSFYESIQFSELITKLDGDLILSNQAIAILRSLNQELCREGNTGLPRGIGISATLSELYMEVFDLAIRSSPNIFYFARYVDDIIVVTDSDSVVLINESIKAELAKIGLKLIEDENRSATCSVREANFNYLGYHFKTIVAGNNKPSIDISIAKSKVNKIKGRIIKSFLTFDRDLRFKDLLSRLRYLSCSKSVKRSKTGDILSGLKYNYRYISDLNKIKVFDGFLRKILEGQSRIGSKLTSTQKDKIRRISFYRAANEGLITSYSRRRVAHLRKAWIDE